MKKRVLSIIIAALLLLLVFPISSAVADDASRLIAYYDFDGDFTDELSGSTLTLIDVIESGNPDYENTTSSFGTSGSSGDTSYWQWTSTATQGGGFCIDVDDLDILENYSIGVRFVFDEIDSTDWDKIIDYRNRVDDSGFYFHGRALEFYRSGASVTGTNTYSAGSVLDIIATRDAATGEFVAYIIEDGTRTMEFSFTDDDDDALPAIVGDKVRFGFFHNDYNYEEATTGGKVYSVKIWNGPITEEQATGAMETPNRLSFNGNGATEGTAPQDILANEGDDVTIPGNVGSLVKTGMHVSMWNTQDIGAGDDIAFGSTYSMPAEDEELFAKWATNTYSVHFNANGGTGSMSDQNFTYGVAQDLTSNSFANSGYTFAGWAKRSADDAVKYSDGQNVSNLSEDNGTVVQLYAKWGPESYDITYHLNGGTNGSGNPETYTTETPTITFADATRADNTFGGWFTDSGCTAGNEITEIASGSTGEVEVWAKWTVIDYNIIYNLNGGTNDGSNPTAYNIESSTITLGNATKASCIFEGWYTDAECTAGGEVTEITSGSTGDVTVWAKWEPVAVTGVTLNEEEIELGIGDDETLVATVAPSDAANQNLTWISSNENVAIVDANGTVTAVDVGTAVITVTTEDGGYTDTCIITVPSAESEDDPDAQLGNVTGTLIGSDGNPLPGYSVILYSDPVTVTTDSAGEFTFESVAFTDHTLIIQAPDATEIGRYKLSFTQGSTTSYTISGSNVAIIYTDNTVTVELTFLANADLTGTSLSDVVITENPQTGGAGEGQSFNWLIWICLSIFSMLVLSLIIIIYFKVRKERQA